MGAITDRASCHGAPDASNAAERVEALLAELRARCGPEAAEAAEELVTLREPYVPVEL